MENPTLQSVFLPKVQGWEDQAVLVGMEPAVPELPCCQEKTAQPLLWGAAAGACRGDRCRPLVGLSSAGVCAASMVFMSTLPFFTGTQELLQLGLCPSSCECFGGEDQKGPGSLFDGPQALYCLHKASGGEG